MSKSEDADLLSQICRVRELAPLQLERVRQEVLTAPIRWIAEYSEYQSGGWWTTSLLNRSGDPDDVVIDDCLPRATSLLERLPQTKRLLDELNLVVMWARLARLSANSFLWEHRDYGDLGSAEKQRLHIPLLTNGSAFLALNGTQVHLYDGYLWRLTPTHPHGACNLLGPDRIHIVIDCYADDNFRELTAAGTINGEDIQQLPHLGASELSEHLTVARRLISLGYHHAGERYLMRLYFRYALPSGQPYDLIADLYMSLNLPDQARAWNLRKTTMLGLAQPWKA